MSWQITILQRLQLRKRWSPRLYQIQQHFSKQREPSSFRRDRRSVNFGVKMSCVLVCLLLCFRNGHLICVVFFFVLFFYDSRFWQSSRQGERQHLQIMSGTAAQYEEIELLSSLTLFRVHLLRYAPNDVPCFQHHLEHLKTPSLPPPPQLLKERILLRGTHNI